MYHGAAKESVLSMYYMHIFICTDSWVFSNISWKAGRVIGKNEQWRIILKCIKSLLVIAFAPKQCCVWFVSTLVEWLVFHWRVGKYAWIMLQLYLSFHFLSFFPPSSREKAYGCDVAEAVYAKWMWSLLKDKPQLPIILVNFWHAWLTDGICHCVREHGSRKMFQCKMLSIFPDNKKCVVKHFASLSVHVCVSVCKRKEIYFGMHCWGCWPRRVCVSTHEWLQVAFFLLSWRLMSTETPQYRLSGGGGGGNLRRDAPSKCVTDRHQPIRY